MNKAVVGVMLAALAGGGFVGMAMTGMIDVPGLSPAKKAEGAAAVYDADKSGDAAGKAAGDKSGTSSQAKPAADSSKASSAKPSDSGKTAAGASDSAKPSTASSAKTPDKAPAKPAARPAPAAASRGSKGAPAKPVVKFDPELGRKKAAKLWNEMSVDALVAMFKAYKGADLPRILAIMDASKVAKVLEKLALDPQTAPQAAKLTKDIQREASQVKPATL